MYFKNKERKLERVFFFANRLKEITPLVETQKSYYYFQLHCDRMVSRFIRGFKGIIYNLYMYTNLPNNKQQKSQLCVELYRNERIARQGGGAVVRLGMRVRTYLLRVTWDSSVILLQFIVSEVQCSARSNSFLMQCVLCVPIWELFIQQGIEFFFVCSMTSLVIHSVPLSYLAMSIAK